MHQSKGGNDAQRVQRSLWERQRANPQNRAKAEPSLPTKAQQKLPSNTAIVGQVQHGTGNPPVPCCTWPSMGAWDKQHPPDWRLHQLNASRWKKCFSRWKQPDVPGQTPDSKLSKAVGWNGNLSTYNVLPFPETLHLRLGEDPACHLCAVPATSCHSNWPKYPVKLAYTTDDVSHYDLMKSTPSRGCRCQLKANTDLAGIVIPCSLG